MRLKMKKPHGTPTFTTHRIRRNMLFGEEEGSRENWKKYTMGRYDGHFGRSITRYGAKRKAKC